MFGTLCIVLSLTARCILCDVDLFEANFVVGDHIRPTFAWMDKVQARSLIHCGVLCGRHPECLSLVYLENDRECLWYPRKVESAGEAIPDNGAVYMKRVNTSEEIGGVLGGCSGALPLVPPPEMVIPPAQCSQHINVDAAFRDINGDYILIENDKYWRYTTLDQMYVGAVEGDLLVSDLLQYSGKPDAAETLMDGTVVIAEGSIISCRNYSSQLGHYVSCDTAWPGGVNPTTSLLTLDCDKDLDTFAYLCGMYTPRFSIKGSKVCKPNGEVYSWSDPGSPAIGLPSSTNSIVHTDKPGWVVAFDGNRIKGIVSLLTNEVVPYDNHACKGP